ncbi:MAG: flagellin [Candidatus Marinimicrobia bacterium]|nr:flagellin [Candidatus Neomarinimicrobiota bacterium]
MSFTRIGANIAALKSLNELLKVNNRIGSSLLKLSSGKRINSVGDDAAGYSLARGLEARRRSLQQALANVGTAKNVLGIAEGGYFAISDILQIIKEKTVQAADDTYSTAQRAAIKGQIDALVQEIDSIVKENEFQGTQLINGDFDGKLFQTVASSGDTFTVRLSDVDSTALALFIGGVDQLVVATAASAAVAIDAVDTAINLLNAAAQVVGESLLRLSSKENTLSVAITNTEAARSRIEDADFAEVQAQLVRDQIIQQTAFSAFAQANAAPQLVLSLFR